MHIWWRVIGGPPTPYLHFAAKKDKDATKGLDHHQY
jgi:hypothetical protein